MMVNLAMSGMEVDSRALPICLLILEIPGFRLLAVHGRQRKSIGLLSHTSLRLLDGRTLMSQIPQPGRLGYRHRLFNDPTHNPLDPPPPCLQPPTPRQERRADDDEPTRHGRHGDPIPPPRRTQQRPTQRNPKQPSKPHAKERRPIPRSDRRSMPKLSRTCRGERYHATRGEPIEYAKGDQSS